MTTMLVQHTTESYEDWKGVFDNDEPDRRRHGATGHRVMRDGAAVTVLIDFPDTAAAQGFAGDPQLKEAMSKAGVVGAPTVNFLHDVESITY